MTKHTKIDKSKFKDEGGRYLTQSLFLELGYKTKFAVFTLDGENKEYEGKTYFSLKKLYLEMGDPTEYEFAKEYLYDWKHWQRIRANKALTSHIDEWEEELELAIRSNAILNIIDQANSDSGFQPSKWLASKGWSPRRAGRPTKAEKQKSLAMDKKLDNEFAEDFERLSVVTK